jgi:hypothetical protein
MDAGLERIDRARCELVDALGDEPFAASTALGPSAVRLVDVAERALQAVRASACCSCTACPQLARSSALIGSPAKAGSSVSDRERAVQSPRCGRPQRLGQPGVFGEQHARLVVLAARSMAFLLHEPLQPVHRVVPAVALIGHEAEGDAERGFLAALESRCSDPR